MTSPLQLNAKEIRKKGLVRLTESLAPEDFQEILAGQADLLGPLAVELEAAVDGGRLALRGQVTGRWELECCRCLAHRSYPYDAKVEASFGEATGTIDVAEEVRQSLLLAVPMKVTCRPDCKGLCGRCGANRNAADCRCPPL